jgi:hypothetical protein
VPHGRASGPHTRRRRAAIAVLDEYYRIAFRYGTIDQLQADLDVWMTEYNQAHPHHGRLCYGKILPWAGASFRWIYVTPHQSNSAGGLFESDVCGACHVVVLGQAPT